MILLSRVSVRLRAVDPRVCRPSTPVGRGRDSIENESHQDHSMNDASRHNRRAAEESCRSCHSHRRRVREERCAASTPTKEEEEEERRGEGRHELKQKSSSINRMIIHPLVYYLYCPCVLLLLSPLCVFSLIRLVRLISRSRPTELKGENTNIKRLEQKTKRGIRIFTSSSLYG